MLTIVGLIFRFLQALSRWPASWYPNHRNSSVLWSRKNSIFLENFQFYRKNFFPKEIFCPQKK